VYGYMTDVLQWFKNSTGIHEYHSTTVSRSCSAVQMYRSSTGINGTGVQEEYCSRTGVQE